jgi:hypothetical protein
MTVDKIMRIEEDPARVDHEISHNHSITGHPARADKSAPTDVRIPLIHLMVAVSYQRR